MPRRGRIAGEVAEVRGLIGEVRLEEEEANAFNENIRTAAAKLEAEVARQQSSKARLVDERGRLLELVSDANQHVRTLAAETTNLSRSSDNFITKHQNLKNGARRLEVIEVAMSCLGAALRRAEHVSRKVQAAINTGNPTQIDPEIDDGFDSESDAPSSTFPPKVAIPGQESARRVAAYVEGIAERFRRYTADEDAREEQQAKSHMSKVAAERAAVETIRNERDKVLYEERVATNELEQERESLLAFLRGQQERSAELMASLLGGAARSGHESPIAALRLDDATSDGGASDNSFAFLRVMNKQLAAAEKNGRTPKRLTVVEQLQEQVRVLKEEIERTKRNTKKWEVKVSSQDSDYDSVKKLRASYRDMESKKILLDLDVRDLETLNKELKLFILQYSDSFTTPPPP